MAGGVSYFYRRFNGSMNFVWGDDRPESGTYGRYYSAITKVDLSLSWKLHNYATLYVYGGGGEDGLRQKRFPAGGFLLFQEPTENYAAYKADGKLLGCYMRARF